jgi:translation initiation factor IF-2
VKDDAAARDLIAHRKEKSLAEKSATSKVSLEDLFARAQAGATKELNIILKADVSGSVEAIRDSLTKLATEKVKVKVILANPGGITESDVMLANASKAIIVGFNVRPETTARRLAEAEHVEIKTYQIIYELLDDVKLAMVGALDKKKVEKYLGRAEVRQTFSVPKLGTVAGCAVIDGKILRNANVRLLRDSRVIFDGKLATLRRFKDDAKEVAQGFECGMGIEKFNDIKIGDLIEAYQIDLVTPELTG